MKTFSENLRYERHLSGISQREFAKIMQVSQSTIFNWENGYTEPSINQIISILMLFDTTFEEMTTDAQIKK